MDERKKDSECWESESWEDKSTKENDKDDEKPPREWKRTRTKLRIWQWRRRRPQRRHQVKTKVITTMTIATTKSTMKTYGVWRNRGKCWINVKKKRNIFFRCVDVASLLQSNRLYPHKRKRKQMLGGKKICFSRWNEEMERDNRGDEKNKRTFRGKRIWIVNVNWEFVEKLELAIREGRGGGIKLGKRKGRSIVRGESEAILPRYFGYLGGKFRAKICVRSATM